jgi:hypothetical protein
MVGVLGKIFGSGIGEIIKPIGDIIDNVTTNKEEKMKAQAEIERILTDKLTKMEELSNEVVVAYLKDMTDARTMQATAIKSDDKFVRRFVYFLAIFVIVAAFSMMALILLNQLPEGSKEFAYLIMGNLTGALTTILAFFFGSTRGSEVKNETIKNLTKDAGS